MTVIVHLELLYPPFFLIGIDIDLADSLFALRLEQLRLVVFLALLSSVIGTSNLLVRRAKLFLRLRL